MQQYITRRWPSSTMYLVTPSSSNLLSKSRPPLLTPPPPSSKMEELSARPRFVPLKNTTPTRHRHDSGGGGGGGENRMNSRSLHERAENWILLACNGERSRRDDTQSAISVMCFVNFVFIK